MPVAEFTVTGEPTLHCAGCESRVRNVLGRVAGVRAVEASHETQRVRVEYEASEVAPEDLRARIEGMGYRVA